MSAVYDQNRVADVGSQAASQSSEKPCLMVTVFTARRDKAFGKIRGLNPNGTLRKDLQVSLNGALCETRTFPTLISFLHAVWDLGSHQPLAFGTCGHATARVASKKYITDQAMNTDVVARTRRYFSWAAEPGVLMLDYDPLALDTALTPEELIRVLKRAVPELRNVAIGVKLSSSSCVFGPDGEELAGMRGSHVFVPVTDARLIPQFAKIIDERLWLAGKGRIKITGNGSCQPVTLFDQSVLKPEHLCFVRATCQDGVRQDFPEFIYVPGVADGMLETETWLEALEPLSLGEQDTLAALILTAREKAEPEAQRVRSDWAELQVKRRCEATGPLPLTERESLRQAFLKAEPLVMPAEMLLQPEEGGSVTVREVLADPRRWHGQRFADPFEPEYRDDRRIAIALLEHGEPCIRSYAHGGQAYLFRTEQQRLEAGLLEFADLAERRRFQPIPAGQFIHGRHASWLVKGILPAATLGMIYGAPASGKTFFMLDLAAAIALGRPWNSVECTAERVICICAEGISGFRGRVHAYMEHNSVDFGQNLLVIEDQPDFLRRGDVEPLLQMLEEFSPKLVIIDTLAQVMPGGDENAATDAGRALKVCRDIYDRTGAMVLLIHHAGKEIDRGPRGWSGLRGALDVEILVSRTAGATSLRLQR